MFARFLTQTFITMSVMIIVIISAAMETDIFVPSFPAIQAYFSVGEVPVQMILGMNFLGLCIASFFYGPLSDAYGRRPVLLVGMVIFVVSSIGCIVAQSIESLLFWRFIQGLGSSVAFVVPGAAIYDLFDKERAAKVIGIYNSVITLAMSFAPIVGSFLHLTFNWRANFIFVGVFALVTLILVWFFAKETLPEDQRATMHLPSIMQGYKKLLTNFEAMANLYIICAVFAGYFVYIANLSLLFINHFGISEGIYSYYQSVILLAFAMVSVFCGRFINWQGMARTRSIGKKITVVGAVAMLAIALLAPENALLITLGMVVFTCGFALNVGIFFGDFMNVYPEIKGIASSLCNAVRLLFTSLAVGLAAVLFNGTIVPVAIIVFVAGISSWLVMLWLQAKQRLEPSQEAA